MNALNAVHVSRLAAINGAINIANLSMMTSGTYPIPLFNPGNRMTQFARRRFLAAVLPALALGCRRGHKFSKDELEHARNALETCLESWKKGEMPEKLRSLPEPIDFAEEGPKIGLKLISYEILGSEHTDSEVMRFSVKLTVQDRRGKSEERRPTYAVALKSPIAVGRDPMY